MAFDEHADLLSQLRFLLTAINANRVGAAQVSWEDAWDTASLDFLYDVREELTAMANSKN